MTLRQKNKSYPLSLLFFTKFFQKNLHRYYFSCFPCRKKYFISPHCSWAKVSLYCSWAKVDCNQHFGDQASIYIDGQQKRVSHIPSLPSKLGTNQNNFPVLRRYSHELESLFDYSKSFQDWLEMGISPNCLALKIVCLVLRGLGNIQLKSLQYRADLYCSIIAEQKVNSKLMISQDTGRTILLDYALSDDNGMEYIFFSRSRRANYWV